MATIIYQKLTVYNKQAFWKSRVALSIGSVPQNDQNFNNKHVLELQTLNRKHNRVLDFIYLYRTICIKPLPIVFFF